VFFPDLKPALPPFLPNFAHELPDALIKKTTEGNSLVPSGLEDQAAKEVRFSSGQPGKTQSDQAIEPLWPLGSTERRPNVGLPWVENIQKGLDPAVFREGQEVFQMDPAVAALSLPRGEGRLVAPPFHGGRVNVQKSRSGGSREKLAVGTVVHNPLMNVFYGVADCILEMKFVHMGIIDEIMEFCQESAQPL
jgi:hypothetical protein